MTDARYVYAVLAGGNSVPSEVSGFDGRPIELIAHGELAAATSVVDPATVQTTVEAVLKHEEVVEKLRESVPLLPVRFGTVFGDAGGVAGVLRSQHAALLADLDRLGDKVEFGLTVLWPEPPSDSGVDESAEVRMSRASASSGTPGPGTQYLQARVMEERRAAELRGRAEALSDLLDADLAPFSLDSRRVILPTPRIAVRAAYLLHPQKVGAYQEAFERSRGTHPELRFLLNGPWPPYSFVSTSGPRREDFPAGESRRPGQDAQEEVLHG